MILAPGRLLTRIFKRMVEFIDGYYVDDSQETIYYVDDSQLTYLQFEDQ